MNSFARIKSQLSTSVNAGFEFQNLSWTGLFLRSLMSRVEAPRIAGNHMTLEDLKPLLHGVRDKPFQGKPGFVALCPVCQDPATSKGSGHLITWVGANGQVRLKCTVSGCDEREIRRMIGVQSVHAEHWLERRSPDQVWDYVDINGSYLFSKAKWTNPKQFRQGVRVGKDFYRWKLEDVPKKRPLYRLPELIKAIEKGSAIHLCEGEKAVDRLFKAGCASTCQSDGAGKGKLRDHHLNILCRAKEVFIWADRDEAGVTYAEECKDRLTTLGVQCRIVQSKTTGEHDDAFDHLEAGFQVEEACPLKKEDTYTGGLIVKKLADVSAEVVSWLWEPRVPIGKLSLLVGDPGVGKSFVSLFLAASLSRGQLEGDPGDTVLLVYEDGTSDTVRPRAEALEADLGRLHVVEGVRTGVALPRLVSAADIVKLDDLLARMPEVRLVIVDPIMSFCGGRTDTHRDAEVREALGPLMAMAERRKVAVLGVAHLRKGEAARVVHRVGGSIAFVALARSVLLAAEDPDTGRKAVVHVKCNLSPPALPLEFAIENGALRWIGEAPELNADRLLGPRSSNKGSTVLDSAVQWLKAELEDGPLDGKVLRARSEDAGHSWATVRRAADNLGVDKGRGPGARWSLVENSAHRALSDLDEHYSSTQVQNSRQSVLAPGRHEHYPTTDEAALLGCVAPQTSVEDADEL